MVTGLDVFRAHFREYADRYLLIGGAACDLLLSAAGAAFRATKDLDVLLCAEALDAACNSLVPPHPPAEPGASGGLFGRGPNLS
jgi:hypothetical protein